MGATGPAWPAPVRVRPEGQGARSVLHDAGPIARGPEPAGS